MRSANEDEGARMENSSEGLDRDQLIRLIEFELSRADAAAAKPGWTTWAIMGALATVAWGLTSELRSAQVDWHRVGLLFLAVSFASDALYSVFSTLKPSSSSRSQTLRFFHSNLTLGHARPFLAVLVVRFAALFVLTWWNWSPLSLSTSWAVSAYLIAALFFLTAMLVLSFGRIPMPQEPTSSPKLTVIVQIVAIGLPILSAASFWFGVSSEAFTSSVGEVRVAGLLWTASTLLLVLSKSRPTYPLAASLLSIRRDLGLNRIDPETARRQVELAIDGLRVSDVLQQEIEAVLGPLRAAMNAEDRAMRELEALVETLSANPSPEPSSTQADLTAAVRRSIDAASEESTRHLKAADVAVDRLSNRIVFLTRLAPGSVADISNLLREVRAVTRDVGERAKARQARRDEYEERLSKLISAPQLGGAVTPLPLKSGEA